MHLPSVVLVQHLHAGAGPGPAPGLPLLATAALYVAVAAAGLLLAPLLTRITGRARSRRIVLSVLALAYAGLLAAMTARDEVGVAVLAAALAAIAVGMASALRGAAGDQAVAGAAVLVVQASFVGTTDGLAHLFVVSAHLVAAAIWLGGVLHLAIVATRRPDRWMLAGGIRRFTPYALGSALALAGTGVVLLVFHNVGLAALTSTGFGALVLTKGVLLVVAGMLGLAHRRAADRAGLRRRPVLLRIEAGVLSSALGCAAVLTGIADPQPVVSLAAPGLSVVRLGDADPVALFVVSTARDRGLLQLAGDESLRVFDRVEGRAHDLDPGDVLPVGLVDSKAALEVTSGSSTATVRLPATAPTPVTARDSITADQTGWMRYQLGRALAVQTYGAHASANVACAALGSRADGVGLGRALRAAGVRRVSVVSDRTSRAHALLRGLREAGVAVVHDAMTLVLASGASDARAALTRVAGRGEAADRSVRAIYLAPWLLDGSLLSMSSALRLPPVTVAAPVDPMSPVADRFRADLISAGGGVAPSLAGLLGYLSVAEAGSAAAPALSLYAATPVGFLPGVLDAWHQHRTDGWFANGTLVATTNAIPLSHDCTPLST